MWWLVLVSRLTLNVTYDLFWLQVAYIAARFVHRIENNRARHANIKHVVHHRPEELFVWLCASFTGLAVLLSRVKWLDVGEVE